MNNSSRLVYKLLSLSFILTAFLILTSCSGGNYVIIKGGIESTNNSMDGSYSKFSGNYYRRVRFPGNSNVHLTFHSKTKSGTLTIEMIDDTGKVLFKSNNSSESIKEIHIAQSGSYKFEAIGKNHDGSFKLNWSLG